jgi:hypothetical protein
LFVKSSSIKAHKAGAEGRLNGWSAVGETTTEEASLFEEAQFLSWGVFLFLVSSHITHQ